MHLASQRDIILISFPFSDLRQSKVRPVIVMSNDEYNERFDDFIAVPLTSNLKARDHTVSITNSELESGNLIVDSVAKVDKIFGVERSLAKKKIGKVKKDVYEDIKQALLRVIS
jgi:mRNA interferase MazF